MLNLGNVDDAYRMRWDYRDMIYTANLGGGGQVFYNYDTGKQRCRKHIDRIDGIAEERIYLGGMELYRRWNGTVLQEEIETHHLFVDDQRILIAEHILQTNNNQLAAGIVYRYQYNHHLGSVGLECDGSGSIISYEEYHPYGTTAYQAKNAAIYTTAKRYKYTGMERDEETGLSYHTARYYASWLGRWASADPNFFMVDPFGLFPRQPSDGTLTENSSTKPSKYENITEYLQWIKQEFLNPYNYAILAPISFADTSGLDIKVAALRLAFRAARRLAGEMGERAARSAARTVTRQALARLEEGIPQRVMEHILEHTIEGAARTSGRAVTTRFVAGTTEEAISAMITETISRGGRTPVLSLIPETGGLAWIIEREMPQAIGEGGERILRVVVDRQGRLLTAYARDTFEATVSIGGISVSAALGAIILFASESVARADESVTAYYDTIVGSELATTTGEDILYFFDPTMFFEPSPTGLEIDMGLIREQHAELVAMREYELQSSLSETERQLILAMIIDQHSEALLRAIETHEQ